jgi:hypothetical protein
MMAKSDAKFAQVDATIARTETNLTRWLMGIVLSIIGLGFAVWKSSQINTYSHDTEKTVISAPAETPTTKK